MKNKERIIQWIDVVLNELSKLNDDKGTEILHLCGGECSKTNIFLEGAEKTRNKIKDEKDLDRLFDTFKIQYYNNPNLSKQGNKITLVFEECTCPLVKEGINNSYLCNCTVGNTKKIFETLFNSNVDVELEQSILNGDKICKQVITIF